MPRTHGSSSNVPWGEGPRGACDCSSGSSRNNRSKLPSGCTRTNSLCTQPRSLRGSCSECESSTSGSRTFIRRNRSLANRGWRSESAPLKASKADARVPPRSIATQRSSEEAEIFTHINPDRCRKPVDSERPRGRATVWIRLKLRIEPITEPAAWAWRMPSASRRGSANLLSRGTSGSGHVIVSKETHSSKNLPPAPGMPCRSGPGLPPHWRYRRR